MKRNALLQFAKDYCYCGAIGLLIEIGFTSLGSLRNRDFRMMGRTSPIMFPIYGTAAIIRPLSHHCHSLPTIARGSIYMSAIFLTEFTSGMFLQKHHCCPWNYGRARTNICSVVRIDYAPYWFLTGLLYEHLLSGKAQKGNVTAPGR